MLSEDDLIQRLVARDVRAMTQFYQRYHLALYHAILRIVRNRQSAEDVLQESLLKIWTAIASYDPAQSRLFTWAAKICCNTAIDHVRTGRFRMNARTDSLEDSVVMQCATAGFSPEHIGVADLLRQLKPHYQQVLDLLYLQGFTQVETAAVLNVPLGTVKTWNGRALHLLAHHPQGNL